MVTEDVGDKEGFLRAIEAVCMGSRAGVDLGAGSNLGGVGTLREKTLHAVCKRYMEPSEDAHEQTIGRFVADAVGEDGIIEIQTGSFSSLKPKLEVFLSVCPTTVVYPLAHITYLSTLKADGTLTPLRRSPKRGSLYDACRELISIRSWLAHPNMRVRLLFIDLEEYRLSPELVTRKRRWRNRPSRLDRVPVRLEKELLFQRPEDYLIFLEGACPQGFTVSELSKSLGIPYDTADMAVYLTCQIGVCIRRERRGREYIYEIPSLK